MKSNWHPFDDVNENKETIMWYIIALYWIIKISIVLAVIAGTFYLLHYLLEVGEEIYYLTQ